MPISRLPLGLFFENFVTARRRGILPSGIKTSKCKKIKIKKIMITPASVELAGHGADELCEAALVGGVNVLVTRFDLERVGRPLVRNVLQALDDHLCLLCCQDVHLGKRPCVCLGALQHSNAVWRACLGVGSGTYAWDLPRREISIGVALQVASMAALSARCRPRARSELTAISVPYIKAQHHDQAKTLTCIAQPCTSYASLHQSSRDSTRHTVTHSERDGM